MKNMLKIAVFVSVLIAVFEMMFYDTGLSLILTTFALILAFYGYVLLQLINKKR